MLVEWGVCLLSLLVATDATSYVHCAAENLSSVLLVSKFLSGVHLQMLRPSASLGLELEWLLSEVAAVFRAERPFLLLDWCDASWMASALLEIERLVLVRHPFNAP